MVGSDRIPQQLSMISRRQAQRMARDSYYPCAHSTNVPRRARIEAACGPEHEVVSRSYLAVMVTPRDSSNFHSLFTTIRGAGGSSGVQVPWPFNSLAAAIWWSMQTGKVTFSTIISLPHQRPTQVSMECR